MKSTFSHTISLMQYCLQNSLVILRNLYNFIKQLWQHCRKFIIKSTERSFRSGTTPPIVSMHKTIDAFLPILYTPTPCTKTSFPRVAFFDFIKFKENLQRHENPHAGSTRQKHNICVDGVVGYVWIAFNMFLCDFFVSVEINSAPCGILHLPVLLVCILLHKHKASASFFFKQIKHNTESICNAMHAERLNVYVVKL